MTYPYTLSVPIEEDLYQSINLSFNSLPPFSNPISLSIYQQYLISQAVRWLSPPETRRQTSMVIFRRVYFTPLLSPQLSLSLNKKFHRIRFGKFRKNNFLDWNTILNRFLWNNTFGETAFWKYFTKWRNQVTKKDKRVLRFFKIAIKSFPANKCVSWIP